jgi:Raf kinase inhibitor-like YbhB/YbcL family protein
MERNEPSVPLVVRSAAFGTYGMIPVEHAVEGYNVAPPLSWSAVPTGTKSVAVVVEDPDAPGRTFVHWIVASIPPDVSAIPAGARLPQGAVQGTNDHGTIGWYGPNPPSGRHRYVFKVYALDNQPDTHGLTKYDLYNAIKGHILAQGELIGTYERKARGVPASFAR